MSIQIQGMDALLRQVEQMGQSVEEAKDSALLVGADYLHGKIVENTPVGETGNLKENVEISKTVVNDSVDVWIDQQGDGFYGYILEIGRKAGTVKRGPYKGRKYPGMEARPFFGPTFENESGSTMNEMKNEIKRKMNL